MKKSTMAAMFALAAFALQVSAKTYYVKANGGSDSNSGLKETEAFATIQKAIDKAAAGSTILVYPGTYGHICSKNKKLTIKATGGAEFTAIDLKWAETYDGYHDDEYGDYAMGAKLCEWKLKKYSGWSWLEASGNATALVGFTIRGCVLAAHGGSLSDCVISGNNGGETWMGLVRLSSLKNCRITRNEGCKIAFCTSLSGCEITDNGGTEINDCKKLSECTITHNGGSGGPLVSECNVFNTLIADNWGSQGVVYGSVGGPDGCYSIYNSTISRNRIIRDEYADDGTRAAAVYSYVDVFNSIVWGNRDTSDTIVNIAFAVDDATGVKVAQDYMNYAGEWGDEKPWCTMMNSLVEDFEVKQTGNKGKKWGMPIKNSTGNITGDPYFIDPEHGDYHLAPWSPCVDRGADYTKKTGKFDLDSAARKVGGKVDMGAYETQPQTAVPADYDGDGVTDAAFFFDASKQWWIFRSSDDGIRTVSLPDANGTPCPADYDGDGKAEPVYFTAAAKVPEFVRIKADGTVVRETFGEKGATPVAAKLDGADAPATFGTYTANAKKPAFSFLGNPLKVELGAKASRPVVADFDADGVDDLGVYTATASKPAFSILQSLQGYAPVALFNGGPVALGPKGAIPCCAYYDDDNKADFGVYMSNTKEPYFQRLFSSSKFRETRTLPMGSKGDVPVVGVYEEGKPAAPAVWTGSVWTYVSSDWEDKTPTGFSGE